MSASRAAHKPSRHPAAAVAALLALVLLPAAAASAASSGGTQAADGSALKAPAGASAPATGRASLHVTSVRIATVSCTPASRCSGNPRQVSTHGTLLLAGAGLKPGMVLAFPRAPGARVGRSSPAARLRKAASGLLVTVPAAAHSGHIMVLLSKGRYTSSYGPIYVYRHALHPPAPKVTVPAVVGGTASGAALDGQGMWIWYVSKSGGSAAAILAQAHAAAVSTVFIKSSDGASNFWSQFTPQLVAELHAGGLKVCAWQYVYGTGPTGEAALGAKAAADGADCLVIDAEAEYEGRYSAAQTYITALRAKVGPNYPVALASFPYVSFHPSLPYSVFLAPGAAQYNAPQMYWKAIGTSVDTVFANTYIANRMYGRPIFPLGQTYGGISNADLTRFRAEAILYGATGTSYWDWQETSASGWSTLGAPLAPLTGVTPNTSYPELRSGSKGDQVLWMQEHLASAVPTQETTGTFGSQTSTNLRSFQTAHAIAASGVTDAATWAALLALAPVAVDWTGGGPKG
jgi:peptidoglycan hydrolase-like protein with peptidoglycan-binding domain